MKTKNKNTYDVILLTGFDKENNYSSIRPYGAYKCARELRLSNFPTLVVNHITHFSYEELKKLLHLTVSHNTLFVGISNSFMENSLDALLKNVRSILDDINPNCKLVLGGATTKQDRFYTNVDYSVIGYADLSIVNLANHLKYGVELQNENNGIINDPLASGFDFVNSIMEWSDDDIILTEENVLPLEVSRGCIFSCKFCSYIMNGRKDKDYIKQYHLLKQELIDNYEKYNITTYRILDDTFNDNEAKLDQLLQIVNELPFKPKFWAYIRLDLLAKNPHTIQKLIDIGIVSMAFGIETLNQTTGKIIGKGADPAELVDTINYLKNTYPQVFLFGFFIIGLPKESIESVQNTMDRLIKQEIKLDAWIYRPLEILRPNVLSWASAFGVDLTKYDYIDCGDISNKNGCVNWSNPQMSYDNACELASLHSINIRFDRSNYMHFDLLNLGYDHDTIVSGIEIPQIHIFIKLKQFVKLYKTQVFKHIQLEIVNE